MIGRLALNAFGVLGALATVATSSVKAQTPVIIPPPQNNNVPQEIIIPQYDPWIRPNPSSQLKKEFPKNRENQLIVSPFNPYNRSGGPCDQVISREVPQSIEGRQPITLWECSSSEVNH